MAVDIVEEILAQKGLLMSAEQARGLMSRWTTREFAAVASTLQV